MAAIETNTRKIAARLERDGWVCHHGGSHDVYKHPTHKGRIVLPRHKTIAIGTARNIAREAGWT